MSDAQLRDLERRARETGDPADALAYRLMRIRMGREELPETSYQVLELHLKSLKKKIASYAKRAHKHGQIPLALHVGEKTWIDRATPDGRTARLPIYAVTMIGDAPTTDDWTFISALHHTPSGTVIQRAWGITEADFSEDALVKYRDRDSACEHCNLRRRRNDTYVLRNKHDGTVIQVGRTCLGDFLSTSPEAALYQFKTERALTEMLLKGGDLDDKANPEWGVDFLSFLTHLNALVRRRGSASNYLAPGAWRSALRVGIFKTPDDNELVGNLMSSDHGLAQQILAEAHEHLKPAQEGQSQADHNLAVIVAEDTVSERHTRVAATILDWYRRRDDQRKAEQATAERALLADPAYRAAEITKTLQGHVTAIRGTGNTITLGADDLARLILANGDLDATRVRLRELLGTDAPLGDHLGNENETGTWRLEVIRLRDYIDRRRGNHTMTVVGLRDAYGRRAVWFATREEAKGLSKSQQIMVSATIYRCGTDRYSNDPETTLHRVQIQSSANTSV